MKKRINVFETNSSSSHSISFNPWKLGKDGNNFAPDDDGKIYVTGDEFGWGWSSHNDSVTKANYYLEQYKDDPDRLDLLKEVIQDYTGLPTVINRSGSGYIDHQSFGTLDLPANDSEALKDWLFNPDNWLYIGNDNDDEPEGFRDPEWKGLDGDHVTVTFDFGGDQVSVNIIGMPTEENLGQKLVDLDLSDGFYNLKAMDLEKNIIILQEAWGFGNSRGTITGKIVKIVSDEFGEIVSKRDV